MLLAGLDVGKVLGVTISFLSQISIMEKVDR